MKYQIKKRNIEIPASLRRGKRVRPNVLGTLCNETNQTFVTVSEFETLEEAEKEFEKLGYNIPDVLYIKRWTSAFWYGTIYVIEDEDSGDWLKVTVPVYPDEQDESDSD